MSETLDCRMYENKYPEVEDVVMVRVQSIAEMGAYVSLLEYNNVEGMILLSELSRRRIRSISKLIRVGRQETVVVLRVDKEKGYIDLSKRRVSPEDVAKCEEKYNKSKAVHSIMRHVAETLKVKLEDLYTSFGWPLYKKFGHAYEAFKAALADPSLLDEYNIDPKIRESLLKNIERRLKPQDLKLRADIEVTCFSYEGIDAIKAALKAGQDYLQAGAISSGETDKDDDANERDKITMVAPPLYVIETTSPDKEKGVQLLNQAIDIIKSEIVKRKGDLSVKVAPRAVSERDDRDLTMYMEQLERQNQEVDGDNDGSDEEDEEDEEKEGKN